MTLSSEDMMKLMAFADGELDGAERSEVEELLAEDPSAARFVEAIAALGDLVKVGHDDRDAGVIAAFDVAGAVMAKVEAEAPAQGVASLAAARSKRGARARVVGGVVAVLALAASVFLLARPSETPMGQMGKPLAVHAAKPSPEAAPSGGAGVDVSAVESPGQSVSVFYLPSGNELSTSVVVWVDETGEK